MKMQLINTLYAIYGASGYGREVMPIARDVVSNDSPDNEVIFIDDTPTSNLVNGHKVVTFNDFMSIKAEKRYVSLAIAKGSIRERLSEQCSINSIEPWGLTASNVVIMDDVSIGEGAILSPFVTITSNVKIGNFFHANIYSYVAHDCIIGDYVTFAPGVKCNGNVVIEDHVYIGTGAIIKQGLPNRPLKIGKGAVIGAGSVVTKNVKSGVTVLGNPASPLSKECLRGKSG